MSKVPGVTMGHPMIQVLTDTGLTVGLVIDRYGDCFMPFPDNIRQLIAESRYRNRAGAIPVTGKPAQAAQGHP